LTGAMRLYGWRERGNVEREAQRLPTRELVERTRRGDPRAFAALVERYQGMVCGLALDATKRFAEAEDIAQETFVDAYRRLASLRDPGKFGAWLRRITLNKIRTWIRKHQARREETGDFGAEPKAGGRPGRAADEGRAPLREAVLRAVEQLPEEQRQAITLFYMDGQSYTDIAEFLDVPVSTVKGRMQGGRRRLKKEMMTMVETVLDAEKPGRELAVRILRRAVGGAKKARQKRDYRTLLECCSRAMGALGRLPATRRRQRIAIDVLHWQGDAQERWEAKPAEAITCYEAALAIAGDIGDSVGQARATRAILVTHGRAGGFKAVESAARRGLQLAETNDDDELLAFCTAAADLCGDPHRKSDEGPGGGFVLGYFGVKHARGKWRFAPPRRRDGPTGNANLSLNLHCGTPARPTVLYHVFGPPALVPHAPDLGASWRGRFGNDCRDVPSDGLLGKSVVEAMNATVTVPAGRFRNCLRIRTTIRPAGRGSWISPEAAWTVRDLTGTRWMWLAPGLGLVRMLFLNDNDGVTDIVVVECAGRERGGGYLPLAAGNWWRYRWLTHYPGAVLTETCRVVKSRGRQAIISCAVHSHEAGEAEKREHGERITRFLRRSAERRLKALGLLRWAGRNPARLRCVSRQLAHLGEAPLQAMALFRLAWQYERDGAPARALRTWDRTLSVLEGPGHAGFRASLSFDAAGACFRFADYSKMLEIGRLAERIFRELSDGWRQADAAGLVDLAHWLSTYRDTAKIGGYVHGWVEVISTSAHLEGGSRASGTCSAVSGHGARFTPACLGTGKLLALPVRKGRRWADSWNTGSAAGFCVPVVRCTVEDPGDTVEVPAGRFSDCVRVRAEVRTTTTGGASPDAEWQGHHDGVRRDWYAPGVGLVKVQFDHANSTTTRVELTDYKAGPSGNRFLPNRLGNRWQFEWRDGVGGLLFREFWRIAAKKGKTTYLGFGAIELK